MRVDSISLEGFRNYHSLRADFHPGVNLIVGDNAQGKTNLLEAISYLSAARSYRARYDRELIGFDADAAHIRAAVQSRGRTFDLEVKLARGRRRQLWANGVKLDTAAELSGVVHTVLFCPEDLSLIKEGAAQRRRFLDDCICQLRPRYAAALGEYRRLYEHKTRILRDSQERPDLLDTLEDFSLRMAQTGALLIHYRAHFIRKLLEYAPAVHRAFSGGGEELGLSYHTVSTVTDPLAPTRTLLQQLLDHQKTHRRAELEARQCLSGPHKDDLEVLLSGRSARMFGSQGQTRTAALSLKLAAREIFFHDSGEWPVLLLDDVLSELDQRRQEFVLNAITDGQVFITCCEEEKLQRLRSGKVFHIRGGSLLEWGER